jgi:hypothetical protein
MIGVGDCGGTASETISGAEGAVVTETGGVTAAGARLGTAILTAVVRRWGAPGGGLRTTREGC